MDEWEKKMILTLSSKIEIRFKFPLISTLSERVVSWPVTMDGYDNVPELCNSINDTTYIRWWMINYHPSSNVSSGKHPSCSGLIEHYVLPYKN